MRQHYDIVIMGAGMVGASLTAALLEHAKSLQLSIALIEPKPLHGQADLPSDQPNYQPSFDSRVTALAYGSAQIFQQLQLWDKLKSQVQPIEHIHVSDRGHFGAARLHAQQEKVPALGYVIENKWLGEVLYQHLQQHQNADLLDFYSPATVTQALRVDGKMQLQLETQAQPLALSTDLLVMADGGRSALRDKMGISYSEETYQQQALVCNVGIDRPHKNIAYERFTDSGPMALLPLLKQDKQQRCGLVWTVPEQQSDQLLAMSEKEFCATLQQRFGFRAGRFNQVGERFSYPLKLQRAQEQVRAGVAILGNAAHTLHPIAGQGFNLALRGVAALAEHLLAAARNGQNLGDYEMLYQYQQSRLADQRATINFSDKSMRLFAIDNPLLALGRDAGLQLLDICPAAKTMFSRSAMGLASPMADLH
ncbi:MAG: 2-octaprenyl-6-methoxyphenyl hydroxylase [Osedax symbiont Rs2]|nr:MAG: 2-octaprenyl-6-methoxyphenyl hydroxylase [Osedax symbiont Rs2]